MSVRLVLAFALALSALPSISVAAASNDRTVSPSPRRVIELAPDLHLREIGPGAYVVAHEFPFLANSALVEMPDGTFVLAGTPWTPDATATLLHWIRAEHGPRHIVAIDTGYHVDNLGGNRALLDAGIPVYGSDLTVPLLRERAEIRRQSLLRAIGPQSPAYAVHASLPFVPPDHLFPLEQGLTLTFGGEEVRVLHPGPTQAPDKVAVYFPGRKLFFGGCMIVGADRLGNIAEADLRHWPLALEQLRSRCPAEVVVPGHSPRLEPTLFAHTIDLLRAAAPR